MANKNTRLEARNRQGNELRVSHTELDSPVLDVNALERLHQFRPDIVDFVIEQTKAEAEFRRKQEGRMLWLTFIERMSGILLAASVCAGGIIGAFFAAQYQHEKLAISIVVSCIGTLAVASLRRKH
ncbi:hypothetical protein [uncultured Cardiobacterium sp.]|uniref:hypothetical protein n=1 Tax=uncultured Cardiobacterium sp. TaxID=417619 RepID=UPI002610F884|nr:hypothetical protein [uncultured Cardiobacterium sp.]